MSLPVQLHEDVRTVAWALAHKHKTLSSEYPVNPHDIDRMAEAIGDAIETAFQAEAKGPGVATKEEAQE